MKCIGMIVFLALALVAQTEMAGRYEGEWTSSNSGAAGTIRLELKRGAEDWKADISFTLGGQDVKCTVTSLKVNGAKLEASYQFALQSNKLESSISGELSGKTLAGKYRTRAVANDAQIDEGTFKAAVQ